METSAILFTMTLLAAEESKSEKSDKELIQDQLDSTLETRTTEENCMGIWEGIKRASKALTEGSDPGKFTAANKQLKCLHCGHDSFIEGSVVLNTLAKSHPGVDFGKSATSLICDECGRVELFASQPERL